jgi:hypothetical protein
MLLKLNDGLWTEWRGVNDDRPARKLTQPELANLLRPFEIRPKTVWSIHRRPSDKSARGYYKWQFESAWASYCQADTPTQTSKMVHLPRR